MLILILSLKNLSKNKELLNIILFSTASFVSLFGTSSYNFSISLYVLKLTGSGLSFATTLIISILSTVLINPFAGVLVDKVNKKFLAIITDVLNGILLLCLYLLTIKFDLSLSMIYISTFFLNIFSTAYGINIEAAKSSLVSEKKLISINSINKVIESTSSLLGPIVGGLIFSFLNINFFILINGFSFLISALLQLFMNFNLNHNNENTEEIEKSINFFTNIIDGATYLKANRDIVTVFKILTTSNFFIGLSINVPMPYIINNVLNLSTKFFGIIEASFPIGMILGALIIRKILNKYSYQKIIKSASILLCFCMIAIGFSSIIHYAVYNKAIYLIYFILIMVLSGISISSIDILIFYVIQETVPDIFKGRVLSIGISIAKIILPIALIISGTLIDIIPTYILPIISGIGFFVFTIFYINPNIQNNIKGI